MFSYYGRKSKSARYYPEPTHDTIIEPFAGAAAYSLWGNNWQKKVILVDKYPVIADIWSYLKQAKPEEILQLPDLKKGDKIDSFTQLVDAEKWLIGFCINRGNPRPVKTANNYNSWAKDKIRIASELHKIRHWEILCCDYTESPEVEATWFVDPPYVEKGYKYSFGTRQIDYPKLAGWCKTRSGQVMVCESLGATWLPFNELYSFVGIQGTQSKEAIWIA